MHVDDANNRVVGRCSYAQYLHERGLRYVDIAAKLGVSSTRAKQLVSRGKRQQTLLMRSLMHMLPTVYEVADLLKGNDHAVQEP